MQSLTVAHLKKRLGLYGASGSGKKEILVERLSSLLDDVPPDMGIGSMYHFDKMETIPKLTKYCNAMSIMVPKR